jgi:RNA polymerase sigma factor (TIGR02999 family)
MLRNERPGHTLQATALVHEADLRMVGRRSPLTSRAHFFAAAAQAMRRVPVDHARRQAAEKRIGAGDRVPLLEEPETPATEARLDLDVLTLHECIEKLGRVNPRQAQVAELRDFGGLSREEVAEVLGTSARSVARDWRLARMMLKHFLAGQSP